MPQEGVGELILRGAQGIVRINQMEQQAVQKRAAMEAEQVERDRLFELRKEQFAVQQKNQDDRLEIARANLAVQKQRVDFEKERIEQGVRDRDQRQKVADRDHEFNVTKFNEAVERNDVSEIKNLFAEKIALRQEDRADKVLLARTQEAAAKATAAANEIVDPAAPKTHAQVREEITGKGALIVQHRFRVAKDRAPNQFTQILSSVRSMEEMDKKLDSLLSEATALSKDPGAFQEDTAGFKRRQELPNEMKLANEAKAWIISVGGDISATNAELRAVVHESVSMDDIETWNTPQTLGDSVKRYWTRPGTAKIPDQDIARTASIRAAASAVNDDEPKTWDNLLLAPLRNIRARAEALNATREERDRAYNADLKELYKTISSLNPSLSGERIKAQIDSRIEQQ